MKKAVLFFQHKTLPDVVVCDNSHQMILSFSNKMRWKCNKTSCIEKGIRHPTWLDGSKLIFKTVAQFMYC